MRGYYFITDSSLSAAGILEDARCAVRVGCDLIQYREKDMDTADMYRQALELKRLCEGSRCRLIINDRIDIALAVDADGIHIGQSDMPYDVARRLVGNDRTIGVTVRSVEEAVKACEQGADYLGVGPVFNTNTKPGAGNGRGVGLVKAIRRACNIPIAAIGGINEANMDEVIASGADMICSISAVVTSRDVEGKILTIQEKYGL